MEGIRIYFASVLLEVSESSTIVSHKPETCLFEHKKVFPHNLHFHIESIFLERMYDSGFEGYCNLTSALNNAVLINADQELFIFSYEINISQVELIRSVCLSKHLTIYA